MTDGLAAWLVAAPDGPLVLGDVPTGAWEAFHEGRCDDAHRPLAERWGRARDLGAPLDGTSGEDALVRGEDLRLRAEHVELLSAMGAAALERAARTVTEHDFVLLLADADGVVVRTEGGGAFRNEATRVRLIEGAGWSEAQRGTNAIGTALTESRPTVVLGRAHFGRRFHGLACFAAPVTDVDGRTVAVLDATSLVEHAVPAVADAVFGTAQVLSELLRLEAYASAGGSVLRLLSRSLDRSAEPTLMIERPGRVARMNAAARVALGGAPAGGEARGLLGLGWSALESEARAPTPGGRQLHRGLDGAVRPFRAHVEPVSGPRGETMAVLVRLEKATTRVRSVPAPVDAFAPVFAEDPALCETIEWARLLARSELPVMILAETGSGKELFAQAIHAASPRDQAPFVPVNCGAVSPTLLESELFGYAPRAFTGADREGRTGLFHAASGGTLFLDEVAEMPLAMQAALLRVLDTGRFSRVGDTRLEQSDVRVVCATCRDLDQAVRDGTFRQDLYFRLKGAALRLPALRDRGDRVPLARYLLERRARRMNMVPPSLGDDAAAILDAHPWPGNVRELISALDVALVASRGAPDILAAHLPPDLSRARPSPAPRRTLEAAEGHALENALRRHRGNVSAAARELGVARSTLYRMARRCGVVIER